VSFDRPTRNLLAQTTGKARDCLTSDVGAQLRRLGFQEDGSLIALDRIDGLTEEERTAGEELRALLDHFIASERGAERRKAAYERLTREIGFTTLNRLAALRMAEERDLIQESVGRGLASPGFQVYERVANNALGNRAQTYRAYLECLYDEVAVDLPLLFDRADPRSRLFPSDRCLEEVLALLNAPGLAGLWREDETIGWVYQYYNDPAERKQMREAAAPRNSHELAVRNQFFTPRYVVEFLTDNTLGRTWYEMRRGDTRLSEECRYLVRRPNEVFLKPGEAPPREASPTGDLSQEELLRQPEYIRHRPKKDPRDLKVLDPACGSGHFLLYTYELLATIYEEAYADAELRPRLQREFPSREDFAQAVPALILRHNLHGIDIDPRACQIATLALWLRAQRAYQALKLKTAERPRITRANIVCAEPMPGEEPLLAEYLEGVDERLRPLVRVIWQKMQVAGEAGSLLKIEEEIKATVEEARARALFSPGAVRTALPGLEPPSEQLALPLITESEERFWETAEQQLLAALADYAAQASNGDRASRRMFAGDATRGFGFIDLCRRRYDVVLMNPPFGEASNPSKSYLERAYPRTKNDVYAAFVERWLGRLQLRGLLGAITSRTGFFLSSFQKWREEILLKEARPTVLADLGYGVLDAAMVETAAYCLERVA